MAAALNEDDANTSTTAHEDARPHHVIGNGEASNKQESEDEDDEDEDEPDEEPKLKYSRLTASLGPVYRNGDATSTFMVAGDKMVRRMLPGFELLSVAEHMLSYS
jgi:hypothetical protein